MTDLLFFYGTLMSGFRRPGRQRIDSQLQLEGRGSIHAALFDLGLYPAAVPASDSQVWGEVHRMIDPDIVLSELDDIEGFRASEPDTASIRARKRRSRSKTAGSTTRGCTSTTRRSAAPNES